MSTQLALDWADAETALLEEEARLEKERERRRAVQARQAQYQAREVSPFAGGRSCSGVSTPPNDPTEKQIRYLCYLGVSEETARSYSRRQASTVIDKLLAQRDREEEVA